MNRPAPVPRPAQQLMVWPFPKPGRRVQLAQRELYLAAHGTQAQKDALGDPTNLPRPWDPSTCTDLELRTQLWAWLEKVVIWLNHEYTWDVTGLIPGCWPQHPHLVNEIAVLADQRRRAGLAATSDPLEEWHRYTLPSFLDRLRGRLRDHCEEGHQPWPARGRHTRHTSEAQHDLRHHTYAADARVLHEQASSRRTQTTSRPKLGLVDIDTGEIKDHDHDDQE